MTSARQAVLDAGVLVTGHFVFADGDHARQKLEMDNLWGHPESLSTVLELLGKAKGLPPADVIIGVPTGGQDLAAELVKRQLVSAPIARLERIPGGGKKDFRFASPADEQLVRQAASVRIYEDVVTTLSSVAAVVKLLNPDRQSIQALAIWRRGRIKPEYSHGVTPHFLVEEPVLSFAPERCPDCQ